MHTEYVRSLLQRQPFEAVEAHLTNGESYTIRHPELALLVGRRLNPHSRTGYRSGLFSLASRSGSTDSCIGAIVDDIHR